MPQGRKGLMTLSGGTAAKWLLHETAPKDTDFALEFSINLKDFARDTLPQFLGFMPAKERAVFEGQMGAPDPVTGLSPKQIMEKLDARVGIFLRLDPTQKFQPAPDAPVLPGLDGVIVMDHLGWLMEALKPQMMQAFARPGSPATATTEGGFFSIRFNTPAGPPPMDYQPVLRFDSKADRILIATRPALFDSVTTGGEKITAGADFARTWRDLPAEGNACIYASTRFMQTLGNIMETAMSSSVQKNPASTKDTLVAQNMLNAFKPFLSHGQAIAFANQPDGMMTMSNTSIALGSSSMETISTVAILASLALPAFTKVQDKANDTKVMNQLKQLVICLKIYSTDQGKYPTQLSDLIKEGMLDNPSLLEFSDPNSKEHLAPLYNNQLTNSSDGGEIILAAPTPNKSGKRIAAFNDGSVRIITEDEFQKLWKKK
jgi:type II secretory pathway pseudopilin PulG